MNRLVLKHSLRKVPKDVTTECLTDRRYENSFSAKEIYADNLTELSYVNAPLIWAEFGTFFNGFTTLRLFSSRSFLC